MKLQVPCSQVSPSLDRQQMIRLRGGGDFHNPSESVTLGTTVLSYTGAQVPQCPGPRGLRKEQSRISADDLRSDSALLATGTSTGCSLGQVLTKGQAGSLWWLMVPALLEHKGACRKGTGDSSLGKSMSIILAAAWAR